MLTALAALALIAASPVQDSARGVIRGTVQSDRSGLPVALAVVESQSPRGAVVGMADSAGRYTLRVRPGLQTFRVRHLEHAPMEMEVLVPPAGELVLDVALEHRPVVLAPVRVRGLSDPGADSIAAPGDDVDYMIGHRGLDEGSGPAGVLGAGFGGDGGGGSGGGDVLYVRGSAATLQLVLLDGAPVYAPFHMGGLIENFEPGVVGSARLYLGGAPARYDGGLAHVMDLSTRGGNGARHAAAGTLDMVSARGVAEGPLPLGSRYLFSARTVHGLGLRPPEGQEFPYRFGDALLRLDVPVPHGAVSVTGFANQEGVRVDTMAAANDGFARWGNLAGSIRWRGRFDGSEAEVTLAGGRHTAFLPVPDSTGLVLLTGEQDRARLGIDFSRAMGTVNLRYGASVDRTWFRHTARQPAVFNRLVYARTAGSSTGAYVDAAWQPTAQVVLRGGLRADGYSVGGVMVMAPRASATWLVSDRAALTLAAGRYHQFVRVARPVDSAPANNNYARVRIPTELDVAGASHLSLGLDQEMSAGVRLGLEGFYKRYDGLPLEDATTAHNSGVDVWVRRSAGEVTGWLGYSLAWAWNSHDVTGKAEDFLGRQTLSAGARGPVWRRTLLSARLVYGDGLAYTPVGAGDELRSGGAIPNAGNLDGGSSLVDLGSEAPLTGRSPGPFLRLDAEVSRTWTPRFAGRSTQVTPYLRVINALESRDALFYRYFDDDRSGSLRSVATLPLVPVAGINWKF